MLILTVLQKLEIRKVDDSNLYLVWADLHTHCSYIHFMDSEILLCFWERMSEHCSQIPLGFSGTAISY